MSDPRTALSTEPDVDEMLSKQQLTHYLGNSSVYSLETKMRLKSNDAHNTERVFPQLKRCVKSLQEAHRLREPAAQTNNQKAQGAGAPSLPSLPRALASAPPRRPVPEEDWRAHPPPGWAVTAAARAGEKARRTAGLAPARVSGGRLTAQPPAPRAPLAGSGGARPLLQPHPRPLQGPPRAQGTPDASAPDEHKDARTAQGPSASPPVAGTDRCRSAVAPESRGPASAGGREGVHAPPAHHPRPRPGPRVSPAPPGPSPAARPGSRRRFLLATSWGGARRPRRPFHFPEAAGRPAGRWRRRRQRLGPSPSDSSPPRSSRGPGAHPGAQPAPGRPGGGAPTRRPRATAAQESSPRSPLLAPTCGRPGLSSKLAKEELPKDPLSSRLTSDCHDYLVEPSLAV
ncbi:basic proline-rich protein-like [Mesoplodon densirostris]|uniref:basic proline-rich protein-like n=1 Tax=Mesoplodon densirostris TaxID=48708 RepID=UPI0028DBDD6B|nr:basic proline-rich protein-like [Mesoplodon densirostris]